MDTMRKAAVAGHFYPADSAKLARLVDGCICTRGQHRRPMAGFVPHAGYMYSGACAGTFYGQLESLPPLVILLGPNHTGLGPSISISSSSAWETPLGRLPVDLKLASALAEELQGIGELDTLAHAREHSIEVHLPFLQRFKQDIAILPVTLGFHSFEGVERFAVALATVTEHIPARDVLLIASTDMSHFISAREAESLDKQALAYAEKLDAVGLYNIVRTQNISMCGVIPSCAALLWGRARGAQSAALLSYTNSGEVSGDTTSVVAYASLGIYS